MRFRTSLLALSLLSGAAFANELHIGLSNHTAEAQYAGPQDQNMGARASWLHHEDDGELLGLGVYGQGNNNGLDIALGAKLFYADLDSEQGQGLALGGRVAWQPAQGFTLALQAHHAPSVTSFSDLDGLTEWDLRISYTVADNIDIFIAYRDVEADVERFGNVELHQGGFAGIGLRF